MRLLRWAGTVAMMVLLVGTSTPARAADDVLIEAEPSAGAVVAASPEQVVLRFAVPITAASLRLFDATGAERAIAVDTVADAAVAATPELLDPGRYLLAWKVTPVAGAGPLSGAYTFAMDPTGTGAVVVDRSVTDSAAATARSLGIGLALTGWVLLAGAALAGALAPRQAPRWALAWAGAFLAGGAGLAFLGRGGFGWSNVTATVDTAAGRGFLVGVVAALAVPYLVLQWQADRDAPTRAGWRLVAAAAVAVSGAGLLVGLDAGGSPLLLVSAAGIVAAAGVAAALAQRWAVAAVAGVTAAALAAVTVTQSDEYDFVYRDDLGPVLVEVAVAPARRGVNELHLYGFDPGGGLAQLEEATASVTHIPTGVGPMEIPLLRAGPNHFLTYGAELPLPGTWEIDMRTATADAPNLETTAIVELR